MIKKLLHQVIDANSTKFYRCICKWARGFIRYPPPESPIGGPDYVRQNKMITCYLRYIIDPHKIEQFEEYAKKWIPLVERFGGQHHGYFLPHEGANNIAIALFSFTSLAAYEEYRKKSQSDAECCAAYEFEKKNRSIISYERTFMRPVFHDKRLSA